MVLGNHMFEHEWCVGLLPSSKPEDAPACVSWKFLVTVHTSLLMYKKQKVVI